jgi:di/tricarboxylate transporter
MNPTTVIYLVILVLAFGLLLTEKLRTDVVAILIILSLAATRVLEPKEALEGFSSEPAIVAASIFVLSAGLHATGLAETVGGWISRRAGSSLERSIAVIMASVAALSAFTHHLTTTAMMLPVALNISREKDIPPSKLLMPLSFAASLGTTITIIGAPAFLLASGALQQAGRPGLGIFSIAPIGIALSIVGTVFVLVTARFLLPSRGSGGGAEEHFRLTDYFTELAILPESPFLGKTIADVEADEQYHLTPVGLVRGGREVGAARLDATETLREGDVLLVRASPDDIVAFRESHGLEIKPVEQYGAGESHSDSDDVSDKLVQAIVAPDSDLAGRTLAEVDFRRRFGAIVLGLWRQGEWPKQELSQMRLREGDVLVIEGDDEALARVAGDRAIMMVTPFQGETRLRGKAPLAGLIMLGSVLLAALNVLTIDMAALAGAAAMVLTRCLTVSQAYRAIDQRIFVFIAGAIPLGTGMKKSGALDLIAGAVQGVVAGWSQLFILLAIFMLVGVLTQFMSDAATTAIFAPVAIAIAQGLGHSPEAYAVTVAMAAVAAFFTPIGHHGNLLVYGPGGYRFADFVKVGTPLTILAAVVVCTIAPLLWRNP